MSGCDVLIFNFHCRVIFEINRYTFVRPGANSKYVSLRSSVSVSVAVSVSLQITVINGRRAVVIYVSVSVFLQITVINATGRRAVVIYVSFFPGVV